jgi:hypothetical protein
MFNNVDILLINQASPKKTVMVSLRVWHTTKIRLLSNFVHKLCNSNEFQADFCPLLRRALRISFPTLVNVIVGKAMAKILALDPT